MSKRNATLAPGPHEFPDIWSDPLNQLLDLSQEFGDVVCLDPDNHRVYLVSHPSYIKHILQDNYRNYRQAADSLKIVLGEGLTVSNGELWLRQRRLMQPAFHQRRLAAMVTTMTDTINPTVQRWQGLAQQAEPFDLVEEMMQLTLNIVAKTMFGADVTAQTREIMRALISIEDYVHEHAWDYSAEADEQITPEQRTFQKALDALDEVIYAIINQRRQQADRPEDLLTMLLDAQNEADGEGLSEKQLRDEVMTIFTAGSETSALTLAWAWYLLAHNPAVEARLHQELSTVLEDRTPVLSDLPKLTYTKMIIEETLRLYPPSWLAVRHSLADDEFGGYHIPANSEIFLCPYITQRHPAFWSNPGQFAPERFSDGQNSNQPRFAYFPFGGGPRICIGNNFALMEMQLILAMLAQNYRVQTVSQEPIKPLALVSLKPQGGLPVIVTLRSDTFN